MSPPAAGLWHMGRRASPGTAAGGFTLIELLVAVGIFALIAAAAYMELDTAMTTRERTQAQMQRLARLQMAYAIIGRDVEQAVARGVRGNYGDEMPALLASNTTLLGPADSGAVLALTRMGWRNPTGVPRSDLQRVAYLVKDDSLVRRYWTELDLAAQSEPLENDLLDGVKQVQTRFMDQSSQWQDQWPPESQANQQQQQGATETLPRAIEITVDSKYFGQVTWVFSLP